MSTLNTDTELVPPERLRLTIEARKEQVRKLSDAGKSQPEIAALLGVNQATVSRDLNGNAKRIAEPEPNDSEPEAKPKRHRAEARIKELVRRVRALEQECDDALDERDAVLRQRDEAIALNTQLVEMVHRMKGTRR